MPNRAVNAVASGNKKPRFFMVPPQLSLGEEYNRLVHLGNSV